MLRGSKDLAAECGLWRENAAWVKKAGGGVWSRRANLSRGSKELLVECGLGERICCLGQRNCWRSVVCGEKTPRGSKDLAAECGLWRENAAWVKKAGGVVWFVARKRCVGQRTWRRSVVCGEKTPRGSRRSAMQCGLWRENAAWVKGLGGGVWSRRANLPRGSKDLAAECGLGGRICRVGQRTWRRSVV